MFDLKNNKNTEEYLATTKWKSETLPDRCLTFKKKKIIYLP